MKIGRVTLSDRASRRIYADESGPAIEQELAGLFSEPVEFISLILPDEADQLSNTLRKLADEDRCELVVTTGGTGPTPRDITPEATRAILEKELPGFGEIMRMKSFEVAPTAILSRATAGIRGQTLIINLPGSPKAVRECLGFLRPAIREALRHLRGES